MPDDIVLVLDDYHVLDNREIQEEMVFLLDHLPPRVHLVIGDRSYSYSPADRERAARISASSERVTVDVLPAGHWVHVDNPDGLLRKLLDYVDG